MMNVAHSLDQHSFHLLLRFIRRVVDFLAHVSTVLCIFHSNLREFSALTPDSAFVTSQHAKSLGA